MKQKRFNGRMPKVVKSGPTVVESSETSTTYSYTGRTYSFQYKHSVGEQRFIKSQIKAGRI